MATSHGPCVRRDATTLGGDDVRYRRRPGHIHGSRNRAWRKRTWGVEPPLPLEQRRWLVGPDFGTSAALFAAASSSETIVSVAVGTGGDAVPVQLGLPLSHWVLAPSLNSFSEIDSRVIVGAALDTIERPLPLAIQADYLDSYTGHRFVDSMPYVRRYPEELRVVSGKLPEIASPVLIIAGAHDPVVPAVNGEFLAEWLFNSRLVNRQRRHFVWEDAPDRYASLLANWVTTGYRKLRGTATSTQNHRHQERHGEHSNGWRRAGPHAG
jgi:pimeloyl-ACP methyl ester carboxylesterase